MRFSFRMELSNAMRAHARRGALTLLLCSLVTPSAHSQHWERTNGPHDAIFSLFSSGRIVFAGGMNGIYRSTNNGASWAIVDTTIDLADSVIGAVYAFAENNENLFAGGWYGIDRSTDNGLSWSPSYRAPKGPSEIMAFSLSGSNIFAGSWIYGVLCSTDNGANWTRDGLSPQDVRALTMVGTTLFAGGTFSGVSRSTDSGKSWKAMNSGLRNRRVSSLLSDNGSPLFAGTAGGVFRSTDSGAGWTTMNSGLTDTIVAALFMAGQTLFAGTKDSGVFLSTDSGASWYPCDSGLDLHHSSILTYFYWDAFAFNGQYLFASWDGSDSAGSAWRMLLLRPGTVALSIDSFDMPRCVQGMTHLQFVNTSPDSLTVDSAVVGEPFSIASAFPVPVPSGTSASFEIGVIDSGGTVTGSIYIFYHMADGRVRDTTLPLSATAVQPVAIVLGLTPITPIAPDSQYYQCEIDLMGSNDSATGANLGPQTLALTLHLNTNLLTPTQIQCSTPGVVVGPLVQAGDSVTFTVTIPRMAWLARRWVFELSVTFEHFATDSLSTAVYLSSSGFVPGTTIHCSTLHVAEPIIFSAPRCGDRQIAQAMNSSLLFRIESFAPNPASDEISVSLSKSSPALEIRYQIENQLGATIREGEFTGNKIDVTDLADGCYYLRVMAGGFVQSRKIIIQK